MSGKNKRADEISPCLPSNYGRGEKIRTSDPLLPKQVRYQAALRPDQIFIAFLGRFVNMITADHRKKRCHLPFEVLKNKFDCTVRKRGISWLTRGCGNSWTDWKNRETFTGSGPRS